VLGSAVIFISGPMLWNAGHFLPFLVAALLSLSSVVVTAIFIKEDNQKTSTPTKLSLDFLKNNSVMKLYLSVFFVFLSYGCITPFFVKYCTATLGFNTQTANTGLLLLTIAGALFAAPIGILSDKIERRKVLMLGTFIFTASLVAAIFARTSMSLYVILSILGIGFIAIQITIYAILAEIVPMERMGEFMGIMNLFISFSQVIANIVMGIILDRIGFKVYFPVSAAVMFIAFLFILFSKFERYKRPQDSSIIS
jgi:predicted MFS family arabinose efflux permease